VTPALATLTRWRPLRLPHTCRPPAACSQATWEDLDLVVDRGDGGPLNPDTLSSRWRKFLSPSGLPHVRFHDLRHAHATLMLQKGVHPKVVSERLGHASVGTTLDIYSHVIPTMQTEAVRAFEAPWV